jgi:hypothetical protein
VQPNQEESFPSASGRPNGGFDQLQSISRAENISGLIFLATWIGATRCTLKTLVFNVYTNDMPNWKLTASGSFLFLFS